MPAKKSKTQEYDPPKRKVQTVRRNNRAPLGRPPEDPKARSVYDGLKRKKIAHPRRR